MSDGQVSPTVGQRVRPITISQSETDESEPPRVPNRQSIKRITHHPTTVVGSQPTPIRNRAFGGVLGVGILHRRSPARLLYRTFGRNPVGDPAIDSLPETPPGAETMAGNRRRPLAVLQARRTTEIQNRQPATRGTQLTARFSQQPPVNRTTTEPGGQTQNPAEQQSQRPIFRPEVDRSSAEQQTTTADDIPHSANSPQPETVAASPPSSTQMIRRRTASQPTRRDDGRQSLLSRVIGPARTTSTMGHNRIRRPLQTRRLPTSAVRDDLKRQSYREKPQTSLQQSVGRPFPVAASRQQRETRRSDGKQPQEELVSLNRPPKQKEQTNQRSRTEQTNHIGRTERINQLEQTNRLERRRNRPTHKHWLTNSDSHNQPSTARIPPRQKPNSTVSHLFGQASSANNEANHATPTHPNRADSPSSRLLRRRQTLRSRRLTSQQSIAAFGNKETKTAVPPGWAIKQRKALVGRHAAESATAIGQSNALVDADIETPSAVLRVRPATTQLQAALGVQPTTTQQSTAIGKPTAGFRTQQAGVRPNASRRSESQTKGDKKPAVSRTARDLSAGGLSWRTLSRQKNRHRTKQTATSINLWPHKNTANRTQRRVSIDAADSANRRRRETTQPQQPVHTTQQARPSDMLYYTQENRGSRPYRWAANRLSEGATAGSLSTPLANPVLPESQAVQLESAPTAGSSDQIPQELSKAGWPVQHHRVWQPASIKSLMWRAPSQSRQQTDSETANSQTAYDPFSRLGSSSRQPLSTTRAMLPSGVNATNHPRTHQQSGSRRSASDQSDTQKGPTLGGETDTDDLSADLFSPKDPPGDKVQTAAPARQLLQAVCQPRQTSRSTTSLPATRGYTELRRMTYQRKQSGLERLATTTEATSLQAHPLEAENEDEAATSRSRPATATERLPTQSAVTRSQKSRRTVPEDSRLSNGSASGSKTTAVSAVGSTVRTRVAGRLADSSSSHSSTQIARSEHQLSTGSNQKLPLLSVGSSVSQQPETDEAVGGTKKQSTKRFRLSALASQFRASQPMTRSHSSVRPPTVVRNRLTNQSLAVPNKQSATATGTPNHRRGRRKKERPTNTGSVAFGPTELSRLTASRDTKPTTSSRPRVRTQPAVQRTTAGSVGNQHNAAGQLAMTPTEGLGLSAKSTGSQLVAAAVRDSEPTTNRRANSRATRLTRRQTTLKQLGEPTSDPLGESNAHPLVQPSEPHSRSIQRRPEGKIRDTDEATSASATEFERIRPQAKLFEPQLTVAARGGETPNKQAGDRGKQQRPDAATKHWPNRQKRHRRWVRNQSVSEFSRVGRSKASVDNTTDEKSATSKRPTTSRRPRLTLDQPRVGTRMRADGTDSNRQSKRVSSTANRGAKTVNRTENRPPPHTPESPFASLERANSPSDSITGTTDRSGGQQAGRRRSDGSDKETPTTQRRRSSQPVRSLSYDADVDRLVETLYRRFERKLRIERERRGL